MVVFVILDWVGIVMVVGDVSYFRLLFVECRCYVDVGFFERLLVSWWWWICYVMFWLMWFGMFLFGVFNVE